MENLENSNCCSPSQDANSNCCPTTPTVENNTKGFKNKLGMFLMGLAIIFAVSSAFKVATSDSYGVLPPSIEDFEWMETDKEVAYVLLKGEEEEQNEKLSTQLTEVILELNGTDGSADHYELTPSHQHYDNFIEKIGVEEVPTVVVLGRGGNISLLSSESVSSIKLFRAYVSATTPAASCNPAACNPAMCDPAACDISKCTPEQRAKCGIKK